MRTVLPLCKEKRSFNQIRWVALFFRKDFRASISLCNHFSSMYCTRKLKNWKPSIGEKSISIESIDDRIAFDTSASVKTHWIWRSTPSQCFVEPQHHIDSTGGTRFKMIFISQRINLIFDGPAKDVVYFDAPFYLRVNRPKYHAELHCIQCRK